MAVINGTHPMLNVALPVSYSATDSSPGSTSAGAATPAVKAGFWFARPSPDSN